MNIKELKSIDNYLVSECKTEERVFIGNYHVSDTYFINYETVLCNAIKTINLYMPNVHFFYKQSDNIDNMYQIYTDVYISDEEQNCVFKMFYCYLDGLAGARVINKKNLKVGKK